MQTPADRFQIREKKLSVTEQQTADHRRQYDPGVDFMQNGSPQLIDLWLCLCLRAVGYVQKIQTAGFFWYIAHISLGKAAIIWFAFLAYIYYNQIIEKDDEII